MTLIELIVALTITGLALSSGYSAYATLADRRIIADQRADAVVHAAAIRSTLVSWLAGARLTIEEDDIVFRSVGGTRQTLTGELPDNDLTFFTSAGTPVGNHGTIIHLFVEHDSAGEHGLIAELSEWRGHQHVRIQLDSATAGLDVSLLSSVLGIRSWVTSWVSSTVLPAGGRLTLSAKPGDSLPPLLRVPITVSIENGR
jgi:prepilin-type N-terminal cleavage/methylation domain-containing protein